MKIQFTDSGKNSGIFFCVFGFGSVKGTEGGKANLRVPLHILSDDYRNLVPQVNAEAECDSFASYLHPVLMSGRHQSMGVGQVTPV